MKVRVNQKKNSDGFAEIEMVLHEELVNGSVISISEFQGGEEFCVRLRPATKARTVFKICKKLKDTGYKPSLSSSGKVLCGDTDFSQYNSLFGHYNSVSRGSRIIIAKVNAPNPPQKPHGLPDPGGKKPKKRK